MIPPMLWPLASHPACPRLPRKWLHCTLCGLLQSAQVTQVMLPEHELRKSCSRTSPTSRVEWAHRAGDPLWPPFAANAPQVCNPSMPPLQTSMRICAAYSTPTDRAMGWLTDVEGQASLILCGFLQLIAGGSPESEAANPDHAAPLLNQHAPAPCFSPAPYLANNWSPWPEP
jgi:hypothetical protein